MENKTKGDFFMKRKLALALAMMMGISSLSVTAFAADDSLEDTGKLTLYYSNSTEWQIRLFRSLKIRLELK